MGYKIFLDANVLLDFTLRRENCHVSRKIIELFVSGNIDGYMMPATVHILAYWQAKAYGKKQNKEIIISLLADITVVDANHEVALTAAYSGMDDMEDALQYFTALHHKMDFFLTRDKHFIRHAPSGLLIQTPEDFLKKEFPGFNIEMV